MHFWAEWSEIQASELQGKYVCVSTDYVVDLADFDILPVGLDFEFNHKIQFLPLKLGDLLHRINLSLTSCPYNGTRNSRIGSDVQKLYHLEEYLSEWMTMPPATLPSIITEIANFCSFFSRFLPNWSQTSSAITSDLFSIQSSKRLIARVIPPFNIDCECNIEIVFQCCAGTHK